MTGAAHGPDCKERLLSGFITRPDYVRSSCSDRISWERGLPAREREGPSNRRAGKDARDPSGTALRDLRRLRMSLVRIAPGKAW